MTYIPTIKNKVSTLNSTTVQLAPGATFQGVGERISEYGTVSVSFYTPFGTPTDGTLWMEVSRDGVEWGGPPRTISDTSAAQPVMWVVAEEYFRIRYVNGSTDTGVTFQIQTIYSTNRDIQLGYQIDEVLSNETGATVVRSVSVGQQPDGDFVNTPADGTAVESTTPLAIGGIYESAWFDTDGWKAAELFIVSDVPSAVDGITIEYTRDSNAVTPVVSASTQYTFSQDDIDHGFFLLKYAPELDGMRIRYTNGAVIQSSFELSLNLRVNPVQNTKKWSGNIEQNSKDFLFKVAVGEIAGHSSGTKFGFNDNIDTGTAPADIWGGAGIYTGMPVGNIGETIIVTSSSPNDTAAGTGARTATLYGLDENWLEYQETVTLNGTIGVTTIGLWQRMNRIVVETAGAGEGNAGILTAKHTTTTTNIFAEVAAGRNQTTIACFTVPAGKTLYILQSYIAIVRSSGSNDGSAEWCLRVRPDGGVFNATRFSVISTAFSKTEIPKGALGPIPAKSDIKFTIDSVSNNGTQASATFEWMLIDDGFI